MSPEDAAVPSDGEDDDLKVVVPVFFVSVSMATCSVCYNGWNEVCYDG